jgi:hypothetical protein
MRVLFNNSVIYDSYAATSGCAQAQEEQKPDRRVHRDVASRSPQITLPTFASRTHLPPPGLSNARAWPAARGSWGLAIR